jgi:hypothetical protein
VFKEAYVGLSAGKLWGKNERQESMKNIKNWSVIGAMLCMASLGFNINSQAAPQITIRYFVLTAAASPNNSESQQNAMSLMDRNGDVGTIDTDIADNPGALNIPHVLRPVDFMSSTGFHMWDGTNNPTGNFAGEYGKRLGVGLDWKDATNTFLVPSIWFNLHSYNDGNNNTLSYSGNLGTDTVSKVQLTFSPTLKGELLDSNGNATVTYDNGESLTNPVNRVEALIRVGWLCSSNANITNDLMFFSDYIIPPFTESATFYSAAGASATNVITSQPYLVTSPGSGGTNVNVTVVGQRQLESYITLSYSLEQKLVLDNTNYVWEVVATGLQDGSVFGSTPLINMTNNQAYYRAFQVPPGQ